MENMENFMKKINKILFTVILLLLLIPITTTAKVKKYETLNLKETLAEENIELQYKDYKETDKQITIYMFRGNNCTYCRGFLEYLNSITEEYGEYFKLVSYEVWSCQNNAILYSEVAEFLEKENRGVPFIIIGDKVFQGYSEDDNPNILQAIKDLYNSKDRYDVFEEMEKAETAEYRKEFFQISTFSIIISTIITLIASLLIIKYTNNKNKELKIEIEKLTNIVTSNENLTIDKDKDKSKLKKENKIKKQKRNINQQ